MFFIDKELKKNFSKSIDVFLQETNQQAKDGNLQLNREWRSLGYDAEFFDCREQFSNLVCEEPAGEEKLYGEICKQLKSDNTCKQPFAIVGAAKMGKTQFLKRLLRDVKDQYDCIAYVSLKDVNCCDKMNILQLLTWDWIAINSQSEINEKKLFEKVVQRLADGKQTKLCIVLDDFEKSNYRYKDYHYDKIHFETMEAGFLVYNILKKWFRNAQKIVLLDPLHFFELTKEKVLSSENAVHVLGLNHVEQMAIVQRNGVRCTSDDCQLGDHCLGFAITHETNNCVVCQYCCNNNCHHEIQSLCYVPYNCNLLRKYCRQPASPVSVATLLLRRKLNDGFPTSFTHAPRDGMDFEKVSKFAWKKYASQKFCFPLSDLAEESFSWKEINFFFDSRTESDYICEDELVFFFSHVLLQELLAALWLLSCKSEKLRTEVRLHRDSFANGSFRVVLEFMRSCRRETRKYGFIRKINEDNVRVLLEEIN